MAKKDLFHKFSYTEQLEEILETKTFSADSKNLLLSMLYKLDTSYNDYETVKRMVDSKKQLIEDILNIIKDCQEIKLIDPNSTRMKQFKKSNIIFQVDQQNMKIETEPNEKALLNAIYSLPIEKRVYLNEEHSAIRNSLPFILEKGKNINRAEIIRDFDAWSWNTVFSEIPDIVCNLIYQNLQILVGIEFLEYWMELDNTKDSIEMLKQKLKEMLDEDDAKDFLNLLFKLSIIIYCENNNEEKNRLREELLWSNEELIRLNDKTALVKESSELKAKAIKEIKKIDKILNSKSLFVKELKKANEKENEVKILTPDDLETNLKRQRKKYEKQIKDANDIVDAKKYVAIKTKIKNENDLLKAIDEQDKKNRYILKLQKCFIKGIKSKINKEKNKRNIIDLLYVIRYYKFIPYAKEKYIKDVKELNKSINELEDKIIDKIIELKIVNRFSNNIEFDKEVIRKIFDMRMINLENINVEFDKEDKMLFYDVETIEKEFDMKHEGIKLVKQNKKIKMFV